MSRPLAIIIPVILAGLSLPATATPDPQVGYSVVAPLNLVRLTERGLASISGDGGEGAVLAAFDGSDRTRYKGPQGLPAELEIRFWRPQSLEAVRLTFARSGYRWTLSEPGGTLVPERLARERTDTVRLPAPVTVRSLGITVWPDGAQDRVGIAEVRLVAEQHLEAIQVLSPTTMLPLGNPVPLEVRGEFSGGHFKRLREGVEWEPEPNPAARMIQYDRIIALRPGPIRVRARYGGFTSPALVLDVGDGG